MIYRYSVSSRFFFSFVVILNYVQFKFWLHIIYLTLSIRFSC